MERTFHWERSSPSLPPLQLVGYLREKFLGAIDEGLNVFVADGSSFVAEAVFPEFVDCKLSIGIDRLIQGLQSDRSRTGIQCR